MLIPSVRITFVLVFFTGSIVFGQSFKEQQLKNTRVKRAYHNKWTNIESELKAKGVNSNDLEVFIRVFKHEQELELWVKNKSAQQFTLYKKIAICASSGDLGPKRKQGDMQVPEGIYDVPFFNPGSSYYLALKVGYPNKSDRILATGKDPGGDIMIHGNCVTIGCIPLQDGPVEDVYLLCVEAKNKNNPIRVEIFPCRMNKENEKLLSAYSTELNKFWNSLKPAYSYFESNKKPAKYSIDKAGNYIIAN